MSSPSFLILSSLRLTVTLLRKVNATAIEKKEGREGGNKGWGRGRNPPARSPAAPAWPRFPFFCGEQRGREGGGSCKQNQCDVCQSLSLSPSKWATLTRILASPKSRAAQLYTEPIADILLQFCLGTHWYLLVFTTNAGQWERAKIT